MNYLETFSHPDDWTNIFLTIIRKLGSEFYKWDDGIGFRDDEQTIFISHRDGKQKAYFRLVGIDVVQAAVAGGWFTTLRNEKKKVAGISLRGYDRKCRVRVMYDRSDIVTTLSFDHDHNNAPIGDKVFLESIGLCNTDDVEIIDVISRGK